MEVCVRANAILSLTFELGRPRDGFFAEIRPRMIPRACGGCVGVKANVERHGRLAWGDETRKSCHRNLCSSILSTAEGGHMLLSSSCIAAAVCVDLACSHVRTPIYSSRNHPYYTHTDVPRRDGNSPLVAAHARLTMTRGMWVATAVPMYAGIVCLFIKNDNSDPHPRELSCVQSELQEVKRGLVHEFCVGRCARGLLDSAEKWALSIL